MDAYNIWKFIVKSAWEILRNSGNPHECFKKIWENGLPFKVSFFVWRIFEKRIPIGEFWVGISVVDIVLCCCCDQMMEETYHHLFLVRNWKVEFMYVSSQELGVKSNIEAEL